MFKLGRKGQTLVMFVVLLPIFLLILLLVVDIGNITLKKKELCNITYEGAYYALEEENKELVQNLILENDKDIYDIEIGYNHVKVRAKLKVAGLVTGIIDKKVFELSCTYTGKIENEKKILERVK